MDDIKLECDRMKTSILILNKQLIIKNDDYARITEEYKSKISSLENSVTVKDSKIELLESKLSQKNFENRGLLEKVENLEKDT